MLSLVSVPGIGTIAEVEQKYTTFVDLVSRPTLPRVDLSILAEALNALENAYQSSGHKGQSFTQEWISERVVDSGPLLRLEASKAHLTKASRYGHPYERYPYWTGDIKNESPPEISADCSGISLIPHEVIERIVESYFSAAYALDGFRRAPKLPVDIAALVETWAASRGWVQRLPPNAAAKQRSEISTMSKRFWTWTEIGAFNEHTARPRCERWLCGLIQK